MKNKRKFIALLFTAILLSSCGAHAASGSLAQDKDATEAPTISLRMLHDPSPYGEKVAVTENGRYYFAAGNTEIEGYVQVYLDYASGQEVPLCQRPECTHTSEGCSALFPMDWGGASEAVVSDKLYYLFCGNAALNQLPRLVRTELNGSDLTELMTFQDGSDYNSQFVTDETNLYLIRKQYQDTAGQAEDVGIQTVSELVKIDLPKKEVTVLHSWQGEAFFLGTQGDMFFVRTPTPLPKSEDAVQSYAIEQIDSKGTLLKKSELEVPITHDICAADNSLFWLDKTQNTIFTYDFLSEQTRKITTDISLNPKEFAALTGVYGKHILLEVGEVVDEGASMKSKYLAFPLDGGAPCEINLSHTQIENSNQVIRIVDEVDDAFLVLYEPYTEVVQGYDPSGNLASFEYMGYKKAFIKQADFFANNPAYYNKVTPWVTQLS